MNQDKESNVAKKLFKTPRKPSINRMLGISKAKAKLTKATGGRAARNPKVLVQNLKRRTKRAWGLEKKSSKRGCWPFRWW